MRNGLVLAAGLLSLLFFAILFAYQLDTMDADARFDREMKAMQLCYKNGGVWISEPERKTCER